MASEDYPSNEIGDLPGVSSFGSDFSYLIWSPGTQVTLCNVPWNSDYRDIVRFDSKAELDTYIEGTAGPSIDITRMTYARPGEPIRINVPFNAAYKFNYLRVQNNMQPVTGTVNSGGGVPQTYNDETKVLYYFITDVRYLAPNTTELVVQLDVWQSFHDVVTFGNCYIERGHIGIANVNAFFDNGREFLTIPEGLDVGGEYAIAKTHIKVIADVTDTAREPIIMVMSTTDLTTDPGTVDDPILRSATGSGWGGVPNGCDIYLFASIGEWRDYLAFMADKPWVTQGIISVVAFPDAYENFGGDGTDHPDNTYFQVGGVNILKLVAGGPAGDTVRSTTMNDVYSLRDDWRDDIDLGRYARLKKFLTYPYTLVELTMYTGTPIILKPESMPGDNLDVILKFYSGFPSPRVVAMPYRYNAGSSNVVWQGPGGYTMDDGGEMYDMQTGIFNMPTFSVVNNGYMGYLASNSNSIAYQHSSADWSQQRAVAGGDAANTNAFRSAGQGLRAGKRGLMAMGATSQLATDTAMYKSMQSLGNNTFDGVSSALTGNIPGAVNSIQGQVNSVVDFGITANQNTKQFGIDSNLASGNMRDAFNTSVANANTNHDYANFAARGDYQNAIAGINAKVQDAQMIQPTTSGQLGGDAFQLSMNKWALYAKIKTLQPAAMAMIGEYWLRYGYAVHRFGYMPSDYHCMTKFTYWKLSESYIYSSRCPEMFKQAIRGIFEKGVTVWVDPDDIGAVDMADNIPKAGIAL